MRFRKTESTIPTIDLIPMLTVMMGVLAFFVVVSISLSNEQLIQVNLPPEQTDDTPTADQTVSDPFIVAIDAEGQELLNGIPVTTEQLTAEVNNYLANNPTSSVYLVPSRELPYEQVMQFLGDMRAVGGTRISLALEKETDDETANESNESAAIESTP